MPKNFISVVLGFDFGLSCIGVAVGQTITTHARPLVTLKAQAGAPRWKEVEKLIQEWQADALVVGMPYHMDGSEQSITHLATHFAHQLKQRFHLPVYFVDERLSTKEAKHHAKNADVRLDAIAAKIILESWLQNGMHNEK